MHLILTGATGLLGSAVLDVMLKTPEITRISILSRRPVQMVADARAADAAVQGRVNVVLHEDFERYPPAVLEQLRGASGVVWALGVSQTQVGREEYVKITKDYALAAAKAFQSLSPDDSTTTDDGTAAAAAEPDKKKPFTFVFVSGDGATHNPGCLTPIFGRVKGETELALAQLQQPAFRAVAVRPAWIDAAAHTAIQPYVPRPGVGKVLTAALAGPVVRHFWQNVWSPTEPLARFLVEMAMGRKERGLSGRGIERVDDFTVVNTVGINANGGLDGIGS